MQSDGDPNLLNANRNDDGQWLNTYYDKPDNRWNRDNGFAFAVSQLSSFLSRFRGRVLFCELTVPAAKHFTGFVQLYGKSDILLQLACTQAQFPSEPPDEEHADDRGSRDAQADDAGLVYYGFRISFAAIS